MGKKLQKYLDEAEKTEQQIAELKKLESGAYRTKMAEK